MASWSRSETLKLIEIRSEDNIQAQLEGCHRNREVYTRISRRMNEVGFQRTFEQCREKVKKLKKEYRRIKDRLHETEQGRSEEVEWPYFDQMDRILGHRPTTIPETVVDTLGQRQENNDESSDAREDISEVDETLFGDVSASDTATVASASTESATEPVRENTNKSKKKKQTRGDQFEFVMNGVVKEMLTVQEKNEERYIELEEKRLRMEEKMLDKEIKMQREAQQFQVKMLQMMLSLIRSHNMPPYPPPVATSTQYPSGSYYQPYDDDATQVDGFN